MTRDLNYISCYFNLPKVVESYNSMDNPQFYWEGFAESGYINLRYFSREKRWFGFRRRPSICAIEHSDLLVLLYHIIKEC